MLKKTVLMGILLIAVLVLSGCGTYQSNCVESSSQKCYGKIVVPKAKSDGTCDADQKNINGWCYAVGDASRCSKLNGLGDFKLTWASVYVPKYNTNICYSTCSTSADCGTGYSCLTEKDSTAKDIKVCTPSCKTLGSTSECLPGLTTCQDFLLCRPNADLSQVSLQQVVQISPQVSPQVVGLLADPNELLVELEENRINRSHAWINIYLTSATHTQIQAINNLKFVSSPSSSFIKVEFHPFFKNLQVVMPPSQLSISGSGPFPITPKAKTYLGRVYLQNENGNPATMQITLDLAVSGVFYDQYNAKFALKMTPFSFCAPDATMGLIPGTNCGAWAEGCGRFVDAGSCLEGKVCVSGFCQSALSQVLSAAAPPKDTGLLTSVSNVLKQTPCDPNDFICKAGKIDAMLTALIAWLN